MESRYKLLGKRDFVCTYDAQKKKVKIRGKRFMSQRVVDLCSSVVNYIVSGDYNPIPCLIVSLTSMWCDIR